jgi:hypothetical protein
MSAEVQAFAGPTAFAQAVRDAFARAATEGWTEIVMCDADFADWPLGERAVIESLQAWSHSRRVLHIYARRYDGLIASQHRFVSWRRQWQHIVRAWQAPSVDASQFQSCLIGSVGFALHRIDPVWSKGMSGQDAPRCQALKTWIEELQDRASPGFPAQQLGL